MDFSCFLTGLNEHLMDEWLGLIATNERLYL